jgi:hypothetical protein
VRAQVNRFVSLGVLEETRANTVRFLDPRLRVFARLRAPMHEENRGRMQFIQAQQSALNSDDERKRDSDLAAPATVGQTGRTPADRTSPRRGE